eukprot:1351665-Rhodomonas_salina.1
MHDARTDPLGKAGERPFEVVLCYDVLHDATQPALLIDQVKVRCFLVAVDVDDVVVSSVRFC